MQKPRISLLNPKFRYTSSANTDIRKTFARERKRLAAVESKTNVTELTARKKV